MTAKKTTKKATKKVAKKSAEPGVAAEAPVEEASTSPPTPTPEQQASIDRVKAAADAEVQKAIDSILGGNTSEATLGTPSGPIEETQDHVQADTLPGTRRKDKTYVPEWVYDDREGMGRKRKVLDYDRFRYCMIPQDDFDTYTLNGWKFVHFDGGSRSGLLGDGWQGTGDAVFQRDLRGYCRRGDVYLMYTEIRNYEEILASDEEAASKAEKAPVGHFADVAYQVGIRPMAQMNGKDIL